MPPNGPGRAACHADFIGKQLDQLMAEYAKLKQQDGTLEADIKEAEAAIRFPHRSTTATSAKPLREKRNQLARLLQAFGNNMGTGQKAFEQLLQSIERALALAAHAEGWSWKEELSKE